MAGENDRISRPIEAVSSEESVSTRNLRLTGRALVFSQDLSAVLGGRLDERTVGHRPGGSS
jgi:hypothetical protein